MSRDNLKPCPFCRGAAILKHTGIQQDATKHSLENYLFTEWYVQCKQCGASIQRHRAEYVFKTSGEIVLVSHDGRQIATNQWNYRAAPLSEVSDDWYKEANT